MSDQSPDLSRKGQHLTPREVEVLVLVANGKTSKEIAATLGIAFKTAVCHRGRILMKLNCRNSADVTRYAVRTGLVH
jgi:two-component system, NarL family, response regulator NreC